MANLRVDPLSPTSTAERREQTVLTAAERPRLAVLTDIGGDPDDQQSMIRLMVSSNEFELELLIASAAGTRGGRLPVAIAVTPFFAGCISPATSR